MARKRGIKLFYTENIKTDLVNCEESDSDDSEKRRTIFNLINAPVSPRASIVNTQMRVTNETPIIVNRASSENKALFNSILMSSPFRPLGQKVP